MRGVHHLSFVCSNANICTKHKVKVPPLNDNRFVFVPVVRDMQQMYDMWLTQNTHNHQADGTVLTQPVPEEKYIAMPTDYAELMVGMLLFFSS